MKKSQVEKLKHSAIIIDELHDNEIFVFGSNIQGRHGKGAAVAALRYGARMGVGSGIAGKTYAIPTRELVNKRLYTLPLLHIGYSIKEFIAFAFKSLDKEFLVTKIGCGLAGYKDEEIAMLFNVNRLPPNIRLPREFIEVLKNNAEED